MADQTLTIDAGKRTGSVSFTIRPIDDDVDEGDEALSVSGSTQDGLQVSLRSVYIRDDDMRGVTLSTTRFSISEGGSARYTVVLGSEPTADVTVTPYFKRGPHYAEVSLSGALTFTAGNWDESQTVTLSTVRDVNSSWDSVTIGHSVSGGDYGAVVPDDLRVTITDPDPTSTALSVTLDVTSIEETAGPTTVTATIALDESPFAGDLDVNLNIDERGLVGTMTPDTESVTVTIKGDETSTTYSFTVTPDVDDMDWGDGMITVTASRYNFTSGSASVTIKDDDTRGITISKTDISMVEGESDTYTIAFHSQPIGDTTVRIATKTPHPIDGNCGRPVRHRDRWRIFA